MADEAMTKTVSEIEHTRITALAAADLPVLDELFDESLVHIHAPGLVHSKKQLLEHVEVRRPYLDTTRGELTVRVVGDVAIVTGGLVNRLRTKDGGERILGGVATQVLRRVPEARFGWRFISFQLTPTTEQAWPPMPSEREHESVVTALQEDTA